MKKKLTIIGSAIAIIGAGSLLAFSSGNSPDFQAESTIPRIAKAPHNAKNAPAPKSAGYDVWIADAVSLYDSSTKFNFDNGANYEYGVEISISDNKAKLKGLFNLWYDDIDKEYVIEGSYDQRSGQITIPVQKFDSEKIGLDGYVKAAEMYSLSSNKPYTLVVFSGDMNSNGGLDTQNGLVFNVSDDMDRIIAQSGFGLYAFDANGNPMGFYDYYKDFKLTVPSEGVNLSCNVKDIDFSGLFVCCGVQQKTSVTVLNRGSLAADISIETSSSNLTASAAKTRIEPGERTNIEISLLPSEAGRCDEKIIVHSTHGDDLTLNVGVDVYERPDYTLITKNGAEYMEFDMSPMYPFVVEERDGRNVAVSINKGSATEAWFTASINIPEGKVGVFSYKGMQVNKQPNGFIISLDKEIVQDFRYVRDTYTPFPIDGTLIIPEGKHTVGFSHLMDSDWYEYFGVNGYVCIYDLDLKVDDVKDNSAILESADITFEDAWFDKLSTSRAATVRLLNIGKEALRVNGYDAVGNFSASIPETSAQQGGSIEIPLTWTVESVGEDHGSVTLHTTAGDFTVNCHGKAAAIPAEYHKIVSNGDFSFDTSTDFPFAYNSNRGYLYNSSSKSEFDEISNSWLDVSFIVPEGSQGKLNWDAYNDSEDLFVFMGTSSVISGTTITIDGENSRSVCGVGVHCPSSSIFTPGELIFKSGRHTVRFNYKKTGAGEKYEFGDDRIKLFELGLEIVGNGEYKGYVTPEYCDFKNIEYTVERDGHQVIGLVNYTDDPVRLISWDHEGPFSVVDLSDYSYEGATPFMVEYHPTKTGVETGSVTLHTNIGDYTVPCSGKGIDLDRGGRIFYESFEYGAEGWLFEDFDGDGISWHEMSDIINNYEYNSVAIPYGYRAMGSVFYAYGNYHWLETPVDNVLFSPEIDIPVDGETLLQFITCARTYNGDGIEVLVGEDADTYIDLYESIWTQQFADVTPWQENQIDLSRYAGKKIRIAFRSQTPNATNAYFVMVDDILVTNSLAPRSSVRTISATDKEILSTEWYSPDGTRLQQPSEGINIMVRRWSDGSVTSEKRISLQK